MSLAPLPPPPTPIDELPEAPTPEMGPDTFILIAFAFVAALETLREQQNAQAASVNDLAEHAYASAQAADISREAVDTNTALVANYASAPPWVEGVYAKNVVVSSQINQRLYRKYTATGATAADPSLDPANWVLANAMVPFTPVLTATRLAETGGRYSLQATAAEGAGTNLLTYSEQFDNAAWPKTRASASANATMAPDGTTTADKLVEDATATSTHYVAQSAAGTTNANPYTLTVYLKAAERTFANLYVTEGVTFARSVECTFDLTAGTAGAVTVAGGAAGSASIDVVGNGWYRCRVTATLGGADGSIQARVRFADAAGAVSYTGNGASGLYAWGAQLESGAAATSYIQSVAVAGTRSGGIVPPQRIVFPAAPSANAYVSVHVANGIKTNVVDPNGQTLEGDTGPALLDVRAGSVDFQFLNNTWKVV